MLVPYNALHVASSHPSVAVLIYVLNFGMKIQLCNPVFKHLHSFPGTSTSTQDNLLAFKPLTLFVVLGSVVHRSDTSPPPHAVQASSGSLWSSWFSTQGLLDAQNVPKAKTKCRCLISLWNFSVCQKTSSRPWKYASSAQSELTQTLLCLLHLQTQALAVAQGLIFPARRRAALLPHGRRALEDQCDEDV